MSAAVDLVADVGEGFGPYRMADDAELLRIVTSANVACGFHAGDPRIMHETVGRCAESGVAVGAHPSFPDLVGFGRRAMELSAHEVTTDVLYQVGALEAFTTAHGVRLRHVCPHGRLGNICVVDATYADAVTEAVARYDDELAVVTQEGALAASARARGLPVAILGLADRAYQDDGTLVSRSTPGAVVHDPDAVVARVVRMVVDGLVESVTGKDVAVQCDTVLVHGDTSGAVQLAHRVRTALHDAGVRIEAIGR